MNIINDPILAAGEEWKKQIAAQTTNTVAVAEEAPQEALTDKIAQLEMEVEQANTDADESRKISMAAVDKAIELDFENKKLWLKWFYAKSGWAWGTPTREEIEKHYLYYKDVYTRENEWKTPVSVEGFSPVAKFELNFVPVSIRPWIENVSERMGISTDFAGISSIVTLAGMTGRRAFVYPKRHDKGWKESISISGAIVGISGTLKTPSFKAFLNPALENDAIWYEEYKLRQLEHKRQLKMFKDKTIDFEPAPPAPCRCGIMTDTTPEAMHENMGNNPEGILYFRDELSGWLEELAKEGRESQRSMFLEAMSGNNPYPLERIGRGKVMATMCASVLGSFQPNRLEMFLNGANNIGDGLVPRFSLLIYPDRRNLAPIDKPEDKQAKNIYRSVVRTLAQLKAESVEMHFTESAQDMFDQWHGNMISRINAEESDVTRSHLSKFLGCLPKIAGLFQLVDYVADGGFTPEAAPVFINLDDPNAVPQEALQTPAAPRITTIYIDNAHLEQALRLLEYLETHANRVYNSIKSPLGAAVANLARHIKNGDLGTSFGQREVFRRHWKGLSDLGLIEMAIQELQDKRWLRLAEPELVKKEGRPGVRWEVNPMVKGVKN